MFRLYLALLLSESIVTKVMMMRLASGRLCVNRDFTEAKGKLEYNSGMQ